ncbi:hypothetical protein PM082_024824 [Marasmius tenuissimus]|nr:hypothetical protein PM082_024824 [Marasmius tenuissimus]
MISAPTQCSGNPQNCRIVAAQPIAWIAVLFFVYGQIHSRYIQVLPCELLSPGIHVVLVGFCITILVKRRQDGPRLYYTFVLGLFILATTSVILHTYAAFVVLDLNHLALVIPSIGVCDLSHGLDNSDKNAEIGIANLQQADMTLRLGPVNDLLYDMGYAVQAVTVTSNLFTDLILIWRCFLVWEGRKRVISLPASLCFVNNVLGYLTMLNSRGDRPNFVGLQVDVRGEKLQPQSIVLLAYSLGSLCSNLLLTSLIVGRVFYISHRVARLSKQPVAQIYRTVIYAVVESGILYPMTLLI